MNHAKAIPEHWCTLYMKHDGCVLLPAVCEMIEKTDHTHKKICMLYPYIWGIKYLLVAIVKDV